MNQRGKVQFTSLVLLAGLIIAGWAAFNWGPIYLDHGEVKQITQEFLSRYTSLQERADVDLTTLYVNRLNEIGEHEAVDAFGNKTIKRGLGITKDQITMRRDNVTNIATVGVEYSRTFQLKPLKKWKTLQFRAFKETAFSK